MENQFKSIIFMGGVSLGKKHIIEFLLTDEEQTADQEPDSALIDHMVETEEMLNYLHTLWTKPEKEALTLLYQNPRMVEDYIITFKCAQDNDPQKMDYCCCCDEAENGASVENSILYRIMVSFYMGVCPHILFLLSTNKTVLNSLSEVFQKKLRWNFKNLDIDSLVILKKTVSEYFQRLGNDSRVRKYSAECGGSVLTYATVLDKKLTIKAVILGDAFSSSPLIETKRKGISILYLAIEKRNTAIIQIFQKLKYSRTQHKLLVYSLYNCDTPKVISASCDQGLKFFHEYLKCMKKIVKSRHLCQENLNLLTGYALCYSFSECKEDILDYLMKKGTFLRYPEALSKEFVGRKILKSNNLDILEKFLRCTEREDEIGRLFEVAVLSGSIQKTELFLHKYKHLLKKMADKGKIRPATLAIIGGFEAVLSLLFRHDVKEHTDIHKLSFTFWTRVLDYPKCESILFSNGVSSLNCTVSTTATTFNPFIEYLELTKDLSAAEVSVSISAVTRSKSTVSDSISALNVIERLIQSGISDLNYEGPNGITPYQMALKQGRHDITRILMLHGADPFLGQCFFSTAGNLGVLIDIFYCNVSCSGNLQKVVNMIFPSRNFYYHVNDWHDKYNGLQFVLNTISWMTEKDRNALIQNCTSSSGIRELVLEFLSTPRSLMRCCRDSLRWKFQNIGIFKYVKTMSVPEKLRKYLLIEEEVETCYTHSIYLPENRRLVINFPVDNDTL